jgi:hypothetical protein
LASTFSRRKIARWDEHFKDLALKAIRITGRDVLNLIDTRKRQDQTFEQWDRLIEPVRAKAKGCGFNIDCMRNLDTELISALSLTVLSPNRESLNSARLSIRSLQAIAVKQVDRVAECWVDCGFDVDLLAYGFFLLFSVFGVVFMRFHSRIGNVLVLAHQRSLELTDTLRLIACFSPDCDRGLVEAYSLVWDDMIQSAKMRVLSFSYPTVDQSVSCAGLVLNSLIIVGFAIVLSLGIKWKTAKSLFWLLLLFLVLAANAARLYFWSNSFAIAQTLSLERMSVNFEDSRGNFSMAIITQLVALLIGAILLVLLGLWSRYTFLLCFSPEFIDSHSCKKFDTHRGHKLKSVGKYPICCQK